VEVTQSGRAYRILIKKFKNYEQNIEQMRKQNEEYEIQIEEMKEKRELIAGKLRKLRIRVVESKN
jgi:translation initiation factor IF-1